MLAGSGQYVRIVLETGVVLDKRIDDPRIRELELDFNAESFADVEAHGSLRSDGLDVVVPIEVWSQPDQPIGVVQAGFSGTFTAGRVRTHGMLVFGLAGGSWLLLMLASILAARTLIMTSSHAINHLQQTQIGNRIRCGSLEINTESCSVRLSGKNIELTPKMFELLAFLAGRAGKTFSDRDLLVALWADAPYAASGDVKQCIYMLRKRLGVACADPKRIIVNVKGFGYKLECRDEDVLSNS